MPIATDVAVNEINKRIMAIETDITRWQQCQKSNNNVTASVPYQLEQMRQEIQDQGGIYYDANAVSHNLIICNRISLLNGNGFILGVSGSGKSMAAKQEFVSLALSTDHDLTVVEPEPKRNPSLTAAPQIFIESTSRISRGSLLR